MGNTAAKKIISGALALTLIFGGAAVLPQDAVNEITGISASAASYAVGEEFTYTAYKCKVLSGGNVMITKYTGSAEELTIPSVINGLTVTELGEHMFPEKYYSSKYNASGWKGNTYLKKVVLPSSLKVIHEGAFLCCTSLVSVKFNSKLQTISDNAFGGCSSLVELALPNSVKTIGTNAFADCTALKTITIPNSVTEISDTSFKDCDNLTINCVKGSYAETYAKSFGINYTNYTDKKVSNCTVSFSASKYYFNGNRIKPAITVKYGSKTLKSGTDYTVAYKNNLNAGTGSVVITGKGAYGGTVTKTFTIAKRSVANCHIDFDAVHYFTNAKIKPAVKVSINGTDVYSGNYTVSYSHNIASGTATITIKGKNNLSGEVKKKFAILPKSISKFTIITSTNSANKYQPKVTVKAKASDSSTVYNGNYTVSYKKLSNTQVQITVTGKNSLRGTKTIKVNV